MNDAPGVEYASVAFWYQTHPHPPFPELPKSLMPLSRISGPDIEGEELVDRAQATGGEAQIQGMESFDGTWGGDAQLWWVEAGRGDRLTLPLEAGANDLVVEIVGNDVRSSGYGDGYLVGIDGFLLRE